MTDFAAIDFETANECPSSVCSVGVVVVRAGVVADTFYSLIHPEPEYYQWFCMKVHGLRAEDTEDAPVFPDVWAKIEPMIAGLPLVAHNARFDEGCLKAAFKVYRMDYLTTSFWIPYGLPASTLAATCPIISSRLFPLPADTTWPGITMPWPMPKPARQSP